METPIERARVAAEQLAAAGQAVTARAVRQASGVKMAVAVDAAERYVFCEFYILSVDQTTRPFFDSLEAAVQRGVSVHVLFDFIGSKGVPGYRATTAHLDAIGVEWRPMAPVQPLRGKYQRPDLRNHRKVLVVDGNGGLRRFAEPDRPVLQQESGATPRSTGERNARADHRANFHGPVGGGQARRVATAG